jgi:hypothetical protein
MAPLVVAEARFLCVRVFGEKDEPAGDDADLNETGSGCGFLRVCLAGAGQAHECE